MSRGGKRRWTVLVILIIIVLIGGYLAVTTYRESRLRNAELERSKKPLPAVRRHIPDKQPKSSPVQEIYTAAIIPSYIPKEKPKQRRVLKPGSVAIVIDDMGASLQELATLTSLKAPLTFSVIPQLPHATEVAEAAHARGYEVMLHIPMEPKGYPHRKLEKDGLLVSLSDQEIDRRLRRYLELVPHAVGANNHMGSRFTEDTSKMLPVMQLLKQKGLFFLDSKTTPLSVGYSLAHELGMKSASRNVFLDNVQEVGAIRAQLQLLAQVARKRGFAIAIGHPHRATIEALTQSLPLLSAQGITYVKLSQVVE